MAIPMNILDTLRFFCLKDASDTEVLLRGPWISPESPEYPKARQIYQLDHDDVPLGIFQPDTPADVARVIQVAKKHAVKFTIRGGGHHIMGRCIQRDTLTIDMRRICQVEVASDRMTATIGGGANNLQVAEALEQHGLVTPVGLVSTVGYVGWATLGGYGSFMNQWGLGVDNIVGAQIVSADGELVTADEDLLRGIRGAGGAFGVIVSLTVKVYPLQKVLAGGFLFEPKYFIPFLSMLEENATKLPPALQVGTAVFNIPNKGRVFRAEILWSSPDLEEGFRAIEQLKSLSPPVLSSDVEETNLSTLIRKIDSMIPPAYGGNETVTIANFDAQSLAVLGEQFEAMPNDPATVIALHHLSPISPSAGLAMEGSGSSWAVRKGHTMIEIIGSVTDRSTKQTSRDWSIRCRDALRATGKCLTETYISMTYPGDRTLEQVFGSKWEYLKTLNAKYDPEGVFELTVPRIKSGWA
ncbi:hypothetical protein G7054_g541 [Neopestalotiopsis clavispora]|nr:hypothetical protein G7054_g541 [Neopestalotiopsis clavispora]